MFEDIGKGQKEGCMLRALFAKVRSPDISSKIWETFRVAN